MWQYYTHMWIGAPNTATLINNFLINQILHKYSYLMSHQRCQYVKNSIDDEYQKQDVL